MPIPRFRKTATDGRSSSASACAATLKKTLACSAGWRATTTFTGPTALGRRTREGSGRDLPQSDRSQDLRQARDRDLGRRQPDPQLHVHRRLHQGTQAICESEIHEPINLGSSELVTINQLVDIVEEIAGVKLKRKLQPGCAERRERPQQRQHQDSCSIWAGSRLSGSRTAWRKPTSGSKARCL